MSAWNDYHYPEAVRIIDFRHAQSYVATIGKAVHGPETEAFKQWYATAYAQLAHRPPPELLANLHQLQKEHDPQQTNEDVKQALHYLETRRDQIHAPHFPAQQVPIGSGIGESGNKVVMQRRLNQAGMRHDWRFIKSASLNDAKSGYPSHHSPFPPRHPSLWPRFKLHHLL